MNGLAILLAPSGDMPVVMGMAGRPPGSAETNAETDGFLGILQQMMIGGSVQMASALSMLPVQAVQESGVDGGGATVLTKASVQSILPAAASSAEVEQPGVPVLLPTSPPGPSPPGSTEVVSLVPAPPVSEPAVLEHIAVPGPKGQVATPQQDAARLDTQEPRPGAIALPIAAMPVMEDADPPVAGLEVRPPADSATRHNSVSVATDDARPGRSEKATPSPQVSSAQPNKKTVPVGRPSQSPLLQTGKQPAKDPSAGDRRQDGNAVRVISGSEDAGRMEPASRPTLASATVSRESAPVESASGEQAQHLAPVKPLQAKTEALEQEAPVAVRAEDGTGKVVVAAKPVAESELRDGETAKNPFQHVQPQISTVKPSGSRVESTSSPVPAFLASLPPETARNVIDQVVKEAAMQVRGDKSEMRITLVPASLGEVTLSVRMERGQMQAQIDVSNAAVKAVLESNMGQLRDALGSRGIDVQRLDVYHSGQSLARDTGGDQGDRSRRQGGRRHSYAADAIEQYDTGRLLGYNTMEMVM
jgi:flagellar hook-length control protein FliK